MRLEALSLQRANRAHISPIGCPYFIVGIVRGEKRNV